MGRLTLSWVVLIATTLCAYADKRTYQPPKIGGVWDCPVDGVTYTINENFGLVNGGGKEVDLSSLSKMGRFVWNDVNGKRATVIIDKNGRGTLDHNDARKPIKCEWQGTGRMAE